MKRILLKTVVVGPFTVQVLKLLLTWLRRVVYRFLDLKLLLEVTVVDHLVLVSVVHVDCWRTLVVGGLRFATYLFEAVDACVLTWSLQRLIGVNISPRNNLIDPILLQLDLVPPFFTSRFEWNLLLVRQLFHTDNLLIRYHSIHVERLLLLDGKVVHFARLEAVFVVVILLQHMVISQLRQS